ncbi:MAG: large repetitive protein [Verrucomicrobiota bacterium]|jgi:hypothetical protein
MKRHVLSKTRVALTIALCFNSAALMALTMRGGFTIQSANYRVMRGPMFSRWSSNVPMPFAIGQPLRASFDWMRSFNAGASERREIAMTAPAGVRRGSWSRGSLSPFVSEAATAAVSLPVRDLPSVSPYTISSGQREEEGRLSNRSAPPPPGALEKDPVIQTSVEGTAAMPSLGVSFEGITNAEGCGTCFPPDTVGAVGPNHYVQMTNSAFAIYSKTGALISAPKAINTLWSSVPNSTCATHNNGDPVVLYDQLADRWMLSQFTVQSGTENYAECIAISQTSDPTGAYWLYQFDESADTFHDYPHLAIWPDGYYMTTNQFSPNAVGFNDGAGAWAFERPKMILGQAARYVYFDETPLATQTYTPGGQLPTNLEGKNPPPTGSPNYFIEVDDENQPNTPPATGLHDGMHIWKFHVDWTTPANSTFGTGSTPPAPKPGFSGQFAGNAGQPNFNVAIADFVRSPCLLENGPNGCSPEKENPPQAPQYLDVLGDRLMHRVTYRNFGDHESLVVQHTVAAVADEAMGGTRNGIRWYEVRNMSGTPSVYQQGTFAPLDPANPLWRWMGSAAMDHVGNIAVGYSSSGPNQFPSLHYAGRLAGDPLNQLAQGEALLFAGLGNEIQVGVFPLRNRWGDYSALTVDPSDDCTFWYTNEYIAANDFILGVDWRTHIGSFKFPQCTVATPALLSVASRKTHGGAGTFDIPLPQSGTRGVECRSGGVNGDFTIVFTFQFPVVNCGTSPNGAVQPGLTPNECVVQMTGVPSGQYATASLNGVLDNHSNQGNVSATFGVLLGDTTGDGFVNSSDIAQTKSQSGQFVSISNVREDVSVDGNVNSTDIAQVKSKSGTALPTPP